MVTICAPIGMDPNQAMAYITAEIIHEVRARYPYDLATEILADGSVIFCHNGDTYVGIFEPSKMNPSNSEVYVNFRFRNADEVSLEAYRLNMKEFLADIKKMIRIMYFRFIAIRIKNNPC